MKQGILLFVCLCLYPLRINAQDSEAEWKKITAFFNAGKFDSVAVLTPVFIEHIRPSLNESNLTIAHFHFGIALLETGRYAQSDSVFTEAIVHAYQGSHPEVAGEIHLQRINRLFAIAKRIQTSAPETACELYKSISGISDSIHSSLVNFSALYERSKLLFQLGRFQDGKSILSSSLDKTTELDSLNPALKKAIISQLALYYLRDKEYDRIADMTHVLTPEDIVDLNIGIALDYEQQKEYELSLRTLNTIQRNIVQSSDDLTIFEYSKKKINLYKQLGRLGEGIDSLWSDILLVKLLRRNNHSLLYRLESTYLRLALKSGRISESVTALGMIEMEASKMIMSPELQTEYVLLKADIAYFQGEFTEAKTFYRELLAKHQLGTEQKATILNNLGLTEFKLGLYAESIQVFSELTQLKLSNGLKEYTIYGLMNTAIAELKSNLTDDAIAHLKQSLKMASENNLPNLEVMASLRLAEAYKMAGFDDLSDNAFVSIKKVYQKIENPLFKVPVLQALAAFERGGGNTDGAMDFLKEGFELAKKSGMSSATYTIAVKLADILVEQDSIKQALTLYDFASGYLDKSFDLEEKVTVNLLLAKALLLDKNYQSALGVIKRNLRYLSGTDEISSIYTPQEISDKFLYSLTLSVLSEIEFVSGSEANNLKTVNTAYGAAKRAVEILVNDYFVQIAKNKNSSDTWAKSVDSYKLLVEIAVYLYNKTGDEKFFEEAFNASEQSRSQSFINDIGSQLMLRMKDPSIKEIEKISGSQELPPTPAQNTLTMDLSQSAVSSQLRGFKITKDTTKVKYKLEANALEEEYTKIIKKLKSSNNKMLDLVAVNYLGINALKSMLSDEEVVLNYFFSNSTLYLFVIGKQTSKLFEINKSPDKINELIEQYREDIQNPSSTKFTAASFELYHLLIQPAKDLLTDKRLLIIPSGRLHNLPFGSLSNGLQYLIETNKFSLLPNASTMQFIMRERKDLAHARVLAIGNPENNFSSPLPGAETEVHVIQQIFPEAQVLVRAEASESRIKQILPAYQVVHFACHGLFNYNYPLLSALALANDSISDGRLELHELYNLNLLNTQLVVLSACETGLAQLKKNDEMVGLVRGFLFSGVPSVIASLWKVDDEGTSHLMSRFYYYLSQGFPKSECLRKAQRDLITSENHKHPFYWAAFSLNGY